MEATATAQKIQSLVGTWNIDPAHTTVEFLAKHMMISTVRGRFDEFSGTAVIDPDLSKSSAEVIIKAAGISTNNPDRDAHLRSPDFLDVEKYPELVFKSSGVEPVSLDEGTFRLRGVLTILDMTLPVTLDCAFVGFMPKDLYGGTRASFTATTSFSRKDFGLTWNRAIEAGGVLIGDEVTIEIQATLIKQTG